MELTAVERDPVTPATAWPYHQPDLDEEVALRLLREGEIDVLGRMPWSSNATYLVRCCDGEDELLAVYKPERGERPLWDFPRGSLHRREVAAFEVSEALGWSFVPDTALRDGPTGPGMLQRFVAHDPDEHYFTLLEEHGDDFRRLAVYDVVINNTDRKGGHCLRDARGRIWGVDHGVAFHVQWKLRTVIWDFAGQALDGADRTALEQFLDRADEVSSRLDGLLDDVEIDALYDRADELLHRGRLPNPGGGYHDFPWPLV